MDGSRIKADVKEATALTKSLERLRKRVLPIFGKLVGDGLGKLGVCVTATTPRAGVIVGFAGICSGGFELAAATLRALQLEVAHKILDGLCRLLRYIAAACDPMVLGN